MKKLTYLVVLYLSSDAIALSVTKDTFLLNQRARTNARKRHWFLQVTADNENSTSGNSTRSVNCNVPAMKRRQKSRGYPLSAYEFDTVPPKSRSRVFKFITSSVFDYERTTRLVQGRSYAKATAFEKENLVQNPNMQDLSSPMTSGDTSDRRWSTPGFRLGVFLSSFFSLPLITKFLTRFAIPLSNYGSISDKFGTGITILYGTLISVTLSILYERQTRISSEVAKESSMLVLLTRNILEIFKEDEARLLAAGDCISNQVRILVKESRGAELLTMLYDDPYIGIVDLLYERGEHWLNGNTRDIIKDLMQSRAQRLDLESSALPPTHFFILTILTGIILLSYVLSIFPTLGIDGSPSFDSQLLFATFVSTYVCFFNFTTDLSQPFSGVYQIRRSLIATHLLETKRLLVNHPLLGNQIDFEAYEEEIDEEIFEETVRMSEEDNGF